MRKKSNNVKPASVTINTGSYVHWLAVILLLSGAGLIITNLFQIH